MDTISASKRTIGNERQRAKACENFVRGGWRFQNGPLCPECGRPAEQQPGRCSESGGRHVFVIR